MMKKLGNSDTARNSWAMSGSLVGGEGHKRGLHRLAPTFTLVNMRNMRYDLHLCCKPTRGIKRYLRLRRRECVPEYGGKQAVGAGGEASSPRFLVTT